MTSNLFPSLTVSINRERYEPSDLFYSLLDLHHLAKTMVGFMSEMDYGTSDNRNRDLDRAFALAKIVSDHVHLVTVMAATLDGGPGEVGNMLS
ncbi:hypothetical protein DEM27_05865 [Metarhizobium album]|uniref:Uncharacterized protein n=1 Tax=Metarhizobium album TaxID=2182425 RepID=A0A2U2DV38_9HYPH|nr:hypothetical protein [Rhizobium album]PWE57167.1 hypothetical protein DEM27_05865 [Rhizobium album]